MVSHPQAVPLGPLVLASGSPRRRALLERMKLDFRVRAAPGDGPAIATDPATRVIGHATFKAEQVALSVTDAWILAADTLVYAQERFLPQPTSREQAQAMLQLLQDCGTHEVWTGACLRGPDGRSWNRADRALVRFQTIPEPQLRTYLQGTEWQDKAGAYAIQEWAGAFARCVEGDLETVVGLAQASVLSLFEAAGLPPGAFLR